MRFPTITGTIDRRILVNYRVDPDAIARVLPPPFQPLLVDGHAIAGVCLIRLTAIRPKHLPWPAWLGLASENAAHRIAVQWRHEGERLEGVFIPRRDTSDWINLLLGGRLFPGEHHHARFDVHEDDPHYRVSLTSDDRRASIHVVAERVARFPSDSVFESLDAASAFFERGSLGYSATRKQAVYDGLELRCRRWTCEPLHVHEAESSFFEDRGVFPEGSATFDNALLMRKIKHEWHGRECLCGHAQTNDRRESIPLNSR